MVETIDLSQWEPEDELFLGEHGGMLRDRWGREISLVEAIRCNTVSPLVRQVGTWAVTEYGLECLTHHYTIGKERLCFGLLRHMAEKQWVVLPDFADALDLALDYHANPARWRRLHVGPVHRERHHRTPRPERGHRPKGLAVRFLILKRDGYRCQLCGASAEDGVRLEVDHKQAKANGGTDDEANLWTLCFPCNRGKGTQEL